VSAALVINCARSSHLIYRNYIYCGLTTYHLKVLCCTLVSAKSLSYQLSSALDLYFLLHHFFFLFFDYDVLASNGCNLILVVELVNRGRIHHQVLCLLQQWLRRVVVA
jgi:hypothetical protein